MERRIWNYR